MRPSFPALAVEGWRGGIGPEARDVGEPFDSDPVRLNRHPLRRLDMDVAGTHAAVNAVNIGNHPLVSNVGLDRLKTRIIGTEPDAVRRSTSFDISTSTSFRRRPRRPVPPKTVTTRILIAKTRERSNPRRSRPSHQHRAGSRRSSGSKHQLMEVFLPMMPTNGL